MRRLPWLVIVGLPFAFESFGVAGAGPKLGLLQVDRLHAGIERTLDSDAKIVTEIFGGTHVVDIAPVADLVSISIGLCVVLVIYAIESAVQIILVFPPGDAGHEMNTVAVVAPGFDAIGERGPDAVDHRDI